MFNKIAKITLPRWNAILFVLSIIFISSCSGSRYENGQLYNTPGFDPGTLPNAPKPSSPVRRVAPDYYYRQRAYNPPQQQQYGSPPPSPYYGGNVAPGSRFYSNPYAIPPTTQYPYYDADQYYVPPTYYRNIEKDQRSPAEVGSGSGAGAVNQKY